MLHFNIINKRIGIFVQTDFTFMFMFYSNCMQKPCFLGNCPTLDELFSLMKKK